jgi:hypothetical protein
MRSSTTASRLVDETSSFGPDERRAMGRKPAPPSRHPVRRKKAKPINLEEKLKQMKLLAFELGMTVLFLVTLYRLVMREIAK